MSKRIKFSDDRLTLLCSFRYALGRRSYIVSHIVDDILDNWNFLSDEDKSIIKREILIADKVGGLGMAQDKSDWYKIINKQ